jgi:signal transduction histidine kinase
MLAGFTSPYFLVLVGCLLLAGAAWVAVWRHRSEPGGLELAVLLATVLFWGVVYAAGMLTREAGVRLALERLMWLGVVTTPVAWLAFALVYTGRRRSLSRRFVAALLVVPGVTVVLVLTNPAHGLVWAENRALTAGGVTIALQVYGPLFWPAVLYLYGLVLAGTYLLVSLVVRTDDLYADQSAALVVGAVVPAAANLLSVVGRAPLPGLDMTPYAFAVSGAAFGYALVRYDLLEFVPATRSLGRDAVVDNMRDAVLIVDDRERVVETNPVAERAFDLDDSVLGSPLSAVFEEPVELPAPGQTRELTTARGNRTFEMTASPLADWQERELGHVLVFRDVTERTLREQRLAVLNRVLRHNLRNDLTVVNGRADLLVEGLTPPQSEHARRIRETALDLVDLSEKARAVDRATQGDPDPVEADLAGIVAAVVADLRESHPGVRIETDLPDRLPVTCRYPRLARVAARNLVENAAEHNDADDPWVRVSLTTADGGEARTADLTVADNGPLIPPQEYETLAAGDETALEHGSGIGLWVVNWCAHRLGGGVDFDAGEAGNRVRLHVPVRGTRDPETGVPLDAPG